MVPHRLKVFRMEETAEAIAHSKAGGTAIHLHTIIPNRRIAPKCFLRAVDRGDPIAHIFDLDRARLVAFARMLGVQRIHVDRDGQETQHIDLCGAPLDRALKLAGKFGVNGCA
jgi:hypothetical protein